MNIGDKIVGEIIGKDPFGYHIKVGNTICYVCGELQEKDMLINHNKNTNITNDGFVKCPYEDGIECSIYLKGSCKKCGMNKEKIFMKF